MSTPSAHQITLYAVNSAIYPRLVMGYAVMIMV
jgi:hypothetical protein